MDSVSRLAKTLKSNRKNRSSGTYGIWLGAESSDANLSRVSLPGGAMNGSDIELRFVPKGAHVTGLTTTSTVLMVGNPLCIVARVVGDITTAVV